MKPALYNIDIKRGLTFGPVVFQFTDADGEAIDLTGYTPHALGRKDVGSAVILDLLPTITDAAAGEVTIGFTDEETAAFPVGKYGWDIALETSDGKWLGPYVSGELTIAAVFTWHTS